MTEYRCTSYLELWLRMRCAAVCYKNLYESEVKASVDGGYPPKISTRTSWTMR